MSKIIAFAGSNSSTSINVQLVKYAASLVKGATVEVIDLRDYDAPIYSSDLEKAGIPESIQALVSKLAEADAYIIGAPEHNGSLSAFFKNILDWASRLEGKFFGGKPALLLSTSGGPRGAAGSLADLNTKMKYFAGEVAATFSLGSFYDTFDQGAGVVTEETASGSLREAVIQFEKAL
ncbi:MAG: NAD(P)H-dependent oxidoreductase [Reichenbachiella sp.]|uniref:NADPH-dependent FMN reductase n=1 Tax=Reichenbachiella sp. TaxID=2184521 RepID=UPI003266EFFF